MFPYYSIHMETLTTGLDDRNFLSREGLCYLEFYKFFKKIKGVLQIEGFRLWKFLK